MVPDLCPEPVFRDERMRIEIDAKQGYIETEWLRHLSSTEYRGCVSLAFKLIQEHGCHYWLSDARRLHYVELADQNWLVHDFFPQLASSVRKIARIMTDEGLVMMDLQSVCDKIEKKQALAAIFQVAPFPDRESALEWLFEEGAR
ncbi:hypothetical protein GCM10023188_19510 [Pontibacter saemangeumensis]|uniref:SpoIIAA-like n=1 Tax=Pontibacter saemangeumensis TaxID=1084525 RepID=A0ABP8LMI5_9BACT